jgi:hypothetical protein
MTISPPPSQQRVTKGRRILALLVAAALGLAITADFRAVPGGLPTFGPAAASGQSVELSEREKARKARNDQHDIQNLRQRREFVVERSERFIQRPDAAIAGDFVIARTAPTVKFQILPYLEPEHFSEQAYQAGWANWAYVTRSDDNRFYFAASDHRGRGAHLNLYEYRPDKDTVERVLDVSKALGWTGDMYTDGKIHGHMGIMPNGTLWAGTHFGPSPNEAWFAEGYRGSWLFSYDINTGETQNHGVPLIVHDLACHTLDTKRGIFMATGSFRGMILSYDVNANQVRFAGYPPNGWIWHPRSMLLDKATGIFWSNDNSEEPRRFMAFSPELNEFRRYDVEVPLNGRLRGHTHEPDNDGWYYWSTWGGGSFFRFRGDWENGPEIEELGPTWDAGRDVKQFAICPEKRYIYYQPGGYPAPLVQYDIKTGQKKAIAFLQDYFFETYGYWPGDHVYGLEVSNDGSFVVIVENGTFEGRRKAFGHPALTVVEIPEQERPID